MAVFTELKNRGVEDCCILVCDGLKGMADSVVNVWPLCTVQTCIIHLVRNTFRYASRADRDTIARDIRPVYTAPPSLPLLRVWTTSPRNGATSIQPSSACGEMPGRNSFRSSTTTPK